jgi:hypothetical protein
MEAGEDSGSQEPVEAGTYEEADVVTTADVIQPRARGAVQEGSQAPTIGLYVGRGKQSH